MKSARMWEQTFWYARVLPETVARIGTPTPATITNPDISWSPSIIPDMCLTCSSCRLNFKVGNEAQSLIIFRAMAPWRPIRQPGHYFCMGRANPLKTSVTI